MSRPLLRALGIVVAAALLWCAGWYGIAAYIEHRTLAWVERQRAAGTAMEAKRLAIDGFPFTWRLVAEDYVIGQGDPVAQRVSGHRLEATLLPWRLHDIPIRLPGMHRFERQNVGGGFVFEIEATRPEARLLLTPAGRMRELDLDLGGLTLRVPNTAATLTAARASIVAREIDPIDPKTRDFWNLAVALDQVDPPSGWMAPFNRPIRRAGFEIGVRGERVRAASPADAVIAWRDSMGVVELRDLTLDWSPLVVTGAGAGGLDRQNRPEAALSFRVSGYEELLNALVESRQIGTRQATGLRIALAALAKPNPQTRRNEVVLPITAQEGQLTILGFPLLPLPPIALPQR
ncbi:MAG: DUF2125 domain-containing protein [Alphaproteobacteria bacterium]|nr:DUF2125 domain-containing protein [Alphaproteobacteria bacterium]